MKRTALSGHLSSLVLLAGFTTALLTAGGDGSAPVGAYTVPGTGRGAGALAQAPESFEISGTLLRPLRPGMTMPMNLRLTNNDGIDLRVTGLAVTVTAQTASGDPSACRPLNFLGRPARIGQALALPAGTSTTLRRLGLSRWRWPRVGMINRPVNQDVCKGALLELAYDGTATEVLS